MIDRGSLQPRSIEDPQSADKQKVSLMSKSNQTIATLNQAPRRQGGSVFTSTLDTNGCFIDDVMKQAPPTASGKLAASALDMRLKGGAMDTIYIGVDFHARQQTICYLTTETGEFVTHELKHQDLKK